MSPHIFKFGPISNNIGCFRKICLDSSHKYLISFSVRFTVLPGWNLPIL